MKADRHLLALLLLLLGVADPGQAEEPQATPSAASDSGTAAVLAANEKFYAALTAAFRGELEPMEAVWSHGEDVTYLGPDGRFLVGWKEVYADWAGLAGLRLGGEVRPVDPVVHVAGELAVCHNFEYGQNRVMEPLKASIKIRTTNIFRKENGVWKMIGHHTDRLPAPGKPVGPQ